MANHVLLGANNAPQAKSMMNALVSLTEDGGRVGQIHSDRKVFTPITANVQQSSAYNGYFKVVNANEIGSDGSVKRKVKIINGASPDSPNAGKSDLGYVRSATLEIPDQNMTKILLVAKYNENTKSYEQYFDHSFSGAAGPVSVLLATVDSMDTVTQQWNNGVICFGGRFFL